jgi:cysteinyl-tRNA synthetase
MHQYPITLWNTLGKKKDLLSPVSSAYVGIYHCGPTVYWTQHIGNMRSVVISDLLVRTLRICGYRTKLVRNYTDVGHLTGDNIGDADQGEDRMTKAVQREQSTPDEIAQKYIDVFQKDITLLNTIPADHTPRATDYIDEMIAITQTLLADGYAYTTDYAIYFSVEQFPDYTKLSGQKLELQKQGFGHGDASDTNKKHPQDFALWFFKAGAHTNALQTWKSPFSSSLVSDGQGFPGWHIECSAMSNHFLGKTFDIHMGGIEHIPIHHTNEIAQSTCANHVPYTEYAHIWMHNEHLVTDNKKMSKSEGTAYTLQDIIDRGFHPLSLRYFFLQAHYQSKQNFTWEALQASETSLQKLYTIAQQLRKQSPWYRRLWPQSHKEYMHTYMNILSDNLDTPRALALIWGMVKDDSLSPAEKYATLMHCDTVLGLDMYNNSRIQPKATSLPKEIEQLREQREQARTNKDWKESDRLRDEIQSKGFIVKDTDQGQEIQKK